MRSVGSKKVIAGLSRAKEQEIEDYALNKAISRPA